MFTQVKTPQDIFFTPQRLLVPLFQRPYVWSREGQWAPLWEDTRRVAERLEQSSTVISHFLGAVVLQQQPTEIGKLGVRTIIDGQQRLTTLQLLFDAAHEQILGLGLESVAQQILGLVENPEHFTQSKEDRYKVWPTNRDRDAFMEVMSATAPVRHKSLEHSQSRMAQAHEYFTEEVGNWLAAGDPVHRANALVQTISHLLQIVVIDLQPDEDAQEIFETLNARGTPLTAADLIKNFVFQRLNVSPLESEKAYREYWEDFETPFWEKEVSAGRLLYSRSSLFLSQWLIAKSKKDVPAREVFSEFKRHVADINLPVEDLLPQIKRSADIYKNFTTTAANPNGPLDRLNMFIYRITTLDSEVIKPLILWLLDPELTTVPKSQLEKAVATLESWLIRRAFVRASTKSYNRFIVDLLSELTEEDRSTAGDVIERILVRQVSPNTYWPGNAEVRRELTNLPIYRRFARGRLRMVLEAIEDHRRGWDLPHPLHEQPIIRGACTIEHIMPQEWRAFWPSDGSEAQDVRRDNEVHTLGNLTLVTQSLNSKVSNGPWSGPFGKYEVLGNHTSIFLTREVLESGINGWTDSLLEERTRKLIEDLLDIWPVPADHLGIIANGINHAIYRVTVADLVLAGLLKPGQLLYARVQAHLGRTCEISEDGRLFIGDSRYETLSAAAKAITGAQSEPGWWFWLVDRISDQSMSDVRQSYLEALHENPVVDEDLEEF